MACWFSRMMVQCPNADGCMIVDVLFLFLILEDQYKA